jgi:hypothetical protein
MEKDKKKTLTISSDLKKKIDTTSIKTSGKKSFSVDKKNLLDQINHIINLQQLLISIQIQTIRKKILLEKFIEQQATKDFIKKDNKSF